uniref:Probable purine permease n=1 Tax=Anthurium amnicola TaxID=1678845 RepID=A0A1D1YGF5_9ARAE
MESQSPMQGQMGAAAAAAAAWGALRRHTLLLLSMAIMVVGGAGGPLLTRIYFLHGGARLWLTSLLQTVGFPIVLLNLAASYLHRNKRGGSRRTLSISARGSVACLAIGVLSALNAYMYAYGSASLPVSTSSLLVSTQVAFTAVFAYLVVRQRFTPYSVNAVVLLVVGPVVLGLNSSGDRPAGVSNRRYYLGFFVTLGAAAVLGLSLPLIELTYLRMKRKITYTLVMEVQVILSVSASVFCTVAMLINKDFQAIPREAKAYELGETKYYVVLVANAVLWQLMNLGFVGVISCSSSLLAGIVFAMLLPVGQILPVLVLDEKFDGAKGVALALAIWGFVSYLYGEREQQKKQQQMVNPETGANEGLELPVTS